MAVRRVPVALALALTLAAGLGFGPCWRIPGGRLSGETATAPPADWSAVDAAAHCALETRPANPHSVTVTCFRYDGHVYVPSLHAPTKDWPSFVVTDPRVRIRIGDRIYPMRATRVDDPATRRAVQRAWLEKYRPGAADAASEVPADRWFFRLDFRAPDA